MAAGMYIPDCSSSYLHEIREENWPIELHPLLCQCHNLVFSPPSLWHWPWYSIRVCQSIFLYSHVELHVPHEHKTSSILVHCQGPFCTPDAPAIKTKDPPHLYFCVKLKFWWIWTCAIKDLTTCDVCNLSLTCSNAYVEEMHAHFVVVVVVIVVVWFQSLQMF